MFSIDTIRKKKRNHNFSCTTNVDGKTRCLNIITGQISEHITDRYDGHNDQTLDKNQMHKKNITILARKRRKQNHLILSWLDAQ